MFKFFSTKKMLPGHVKALRASRKQLITDKVINYDNGLFFEHNTFEKPIYVMPKEDYILKELAALEIAENGDYDFSKLSTGFKKYMRLKDDEFFNKSYNDWKNNEKYREMREQREIDKVEEYHDRGLFESELMTILGGDKIAIETPMYLKARKSNRRAYKTVIELIRANLEFLESFVTLTFADIAHEQKYIDNGIHFDLVDGLDDFENVKKIFSDFMKTFAQKLRRNGHTFEYIAVYEQHKSGRYHFHLLSSKIPDEYKIKCPDFLDEDKFTGKKRNGYMIADWLHGKSDIEQIRDKEKISTYICKYLIKNFMSLEEDEEEYKEYFGKKKYFRSAGLKQPTVEYFGLRDERELELIEKKKAMYCDEYTTIYKNPYNDSQIKRTICSKKNIS